MLADQFGSSQADAALLLSKRLRVLKGRIEAERFVLRLAGKLGSAVGAVNQASLSRRVRSRRTLAVEASSARPLIDGGVAVTQQHLENFLSALIGLCRHRKLEPRICLNGLGFLCQRGQGMNQCAHALFANSKSAVFTIAQVAHGHASLRKRTGLGKAVRALEWNSLAPVE